MRSHRAGLRHFGPAFVLAAACAALPGRAADPASGTLTVANVQSSPVTYQGGPYTGANPTPQAEPVCDPGPTCDVYTLTVSLPDNYAAAHPDDLIVIEIQWPNPTNDFDIYVRDAEGNLVGSSPSGSDPEVIVLPAGSGTRTYTIESIVFAAANETFTGTIYLVNVPDPCATAGGQ